jgi:hypothetical protein
MFTEQAKFITMQIVSNIFRKVANVLLRGASALDITYNEINIIVYYLLIPISWTIMLDFYLGYPITTCALALIWLCINLEPGEGSENGVIGRLCAPLIS